MRPEEEARQLVERFKYKGKSFRMSEESAVECALICVDEILGNIVLGELDYTYYKEVRQEINRR